MLELLTDTGVDLARSAARHGEGLFETVRVQAGQPRWLTEHLQRLAAGCAFLGLEPPPAANAVLAFLEAATPIRTLARGALRLLAVDGQLQVTLGPAPGPLPGPLRLGLSRDCRRLSDSPLNRFKTLSYLENRLLAREAERRGLFELIALNELGQLTDGSRTSLFLVGPEQLLTPPVAAGALPGIARRVLLEAGLAREAVLTAADLAAAPALLLANALRGALPVAELEGRALNQKQPLLEAAAVLLA